MHRFPQLKFTPTSPARDYAKPMMELIPAPNPHPNETHRFLLLLLSPFSHADDAALIKQLLAENLDKRTFAFADVVLASSGKKVIPLDSNNAAHLRITRAIRIALDQALVALSREDSPVRKLRRINEASRYFEDALMLSINQSPGLRCEIPPTKKVTFSARVIPTSRSRIAIQASSPTSIRNLSNQNHYIPRYGRFITSPSMKHSRSMTMPFICFVASSTMAKRASGHSLAFTSLISPRYACG